MVVVVITMALSLGTGPITFGRSVSRAFNKRRGLAVGIMLSGSGLTAIVVPQVLGPIIRDSGWRTGYMVLAGTVLVSTCIVYLLLPADRPQSGSRQAKAAPKLPPIPARRIISDPVFLRLAAAFVCMALAIGGLVIHLYDLMLRSGVSAERALWVQSALGVSVVVGRLVSGYLYDRIFAPYVAAVTMALGAIGLGSMLVAGPEVAIIAAFAVGFCLGAEVDIVTLLISRYFSLNRFSQIYSLAYAAYILGLAVSPYMLGLIVDHTAGFGPTIATSVTLLAITVVLFAIMPRYTTTPRFSEVETPEATLKVGGLS